MSAGLIDSVAKIVSSPPAQSAAGAALAALVWRTFQSVENVLNKKAKRQIAAWLYGVRVMPKLDRWHDQFLNAISGFGDGESEQIVCRSSSRSSDAFNSPATVSASSAKTISSTLIFR